jgi:hypothetical protein
MNLIKRTGLGIKPALQPSLDDDDSVRSGADAKPDLFTRGLSSLLAFLDNSDVQDTALRISMESDSRRCVELDTAVRCLSRYHDAHTVCRIVWQLLSTLRDALLPPQLRLKFHGALVWAAVMDRSSSSQSPSQLLIDLLSCLCSQLHQQPASCVRNATAELRALMDAASTTRLQQQIDSVELRAWLETDLMSSVQNMTSLGGLIDSLGEENAAMLHWSHETMKSLASSSGVIDQEIATVIIPNGKRDGSGGQAEFDESGEHQPVFKGTVEEALSILDIYEELLHDFSMSLQSLLNSFSKLSIDLNGLDGVLYISPSVVAATNMLTDRGSNLRGNLMNSLTHPHHYQALSDTSSSSSSSIDQSHSKKQQHKSSNFVPDVSAFVDRIRYAQPVETAYSWYEHFCAHVAQHPFDMDTLKNHNHNNRKRSRSDSDNQTFSDHEIRQFRFISALHDLEKTGIIQVKNFQDKPAIVKLMYTGLNG